MSFFYEFNEQILEVSWLKVCGKSKGRKKQQRADNKSRNTLHKNIKITYLKGQLFVAVAQLSELVGPIATVKCYFERGSR